MDEAGVPTIGCRVILEIAAAPRREPGSGIDAHPGGVDVEAGQVNRAFRVAAGLHPRVERTPRGPPNSITRTIRQVASRRLAASDVPGPAV